MSENPFLLSQTARRPSGGGRAPPGSHRWPRWPQLFPPPSLDSDTVVVTDVPAELDPVSVLELDETLRAAILDWGRPVEAGGTVIVDLANVTFISSSGVPAELADHG